MKEVERGGRWGCGRICNLVGYKEDVGYARAKFVGRPERESQLHSRARWSEIASKRALID